MNDVKYKSLKPIHSILYALHSTLSAIRITTHTLRHHLIVSVSCFLLLLVFVSAGYSQHISTSINKSNILIGDPFILTVKIARSNQDTIYFDEKQDISPFEILSVCKETNANENIIIDKYVIRLSSFETGEHILHSLAFKISSQEEPIYSDSIYVNVKSVLPDSMQNSKIRDIVDPVSLSLKFWDYFLIFLLIILIIVILWLLKKVSKKEKIVEVLEKKEKKLTAHQIALSALNKLKNSNLLDQGNIKEFYIILSWIIREYLENRYFIKALEQTSQEIKESLREKNVKERYEFVNLLQDCDLVKYAKFIPYKEEAEKLLEKAFYLVEQTKLQQVKENT